MGLVWILLVKGIILDCCVWMVLGRKWWWIFWIDEVFCWWIWLGDKWGYLFNWNALDDLIWLLDWIWLDWIRLGGGC